MVRAASVIIINACNPAHVQAPTWAQATSGLSFGSGTPSTVLTLQSLVGELNTVIDLAGGTRAFDFGTMSQLLTTLSGKPAVMCHLQSPCFMMGMRTIRTLCDFIEGCGKVELLIDLASAGRRHSVLKGIAM